jgi:hypothetical protein
MTILEPNSTSDQIVKYIPFKNDTITKIEFLDEQKNVTTEATFNSQTTESFYHKINVNISLNDGYIYMMVFYNGTDVIFRDKCFSTSQPISTYSVNNGVYVNAPSSTNEYIIL